MCFMFYAPTPPPPPSRENNITPELQISLGSIGYFHILIILNCVLAKSIVYFYFFTPHFLWLQIMYPMFFLLNVAIGNLPACIYSLTLFAFLEHQTSRFNYTSEAYLVPLLIFIARIRIVSFTSMCFFFLLNTRLVIDILSIKLEFYCAHASKKNQYPTGIYVLPKWKRNGPNGTQ